MTTVNSASGGQKLASTTGSAWNDGKIEAKEILLEDSPLKDFLSANMDVFANLLTFTNGQESSYTLEGLLASIGEESFGFLTSGEGTDAQFADEVKALTDRIENFTTLVKELSKSETELEAKLAKLNDELASAEGDDKKPIQTEIDKTKAQQAMVKAAKAETTKQLKALVKQISDASAEAQKENEVGNKLKANFSALDKKMADKLVEVKNAAEETLDGLKSSDSKTPAGKAKAATVTFGGKEGAKATGGDGEAANTAAGQPQGKAKAAQSTFGSGPYGEPRAGSAPGFSDADMNNMLFSGYWNDLRAAGMEEVSKKQNDSKLMQMFALLAMRAATGDIGAMVQFMRFVGHIIAKDKAMQNVQMAKKLMELQDASRKDTERLLEADAYDPNDPAAQQEFVKLQQSVNANQGVLATSQKLIASLMEEFTQVAEMMEGMSKSLLDARGRVLQMISVWR